MMNKNKTFPCSGCGACCRRISKAVENLGVAATDINSDLYFPYTWDNNGVCKMLGEDNKCMVYETRPLMCNIDKYMLSRGIDKEYFYSINAMACNIMMGEDKLPIKFRIK